MRYKILVVLPDGVTRRIEEIDESGGYYDASKILWDEREDGSLPEVDIKGAKRVKGVLEFDQAVKTAHVAKETERTSIKNQKAIDKQVVLDRIGITEDELRLILSES